MSDAVVATHLRENPYELAKDQLTRVGQIFGIDPNLVRVLSQVKKAVEVSIPVVDGRRDDRGVLGLPRDPQHRARAVEGRHPLPPERHAGRDQGPRDVDDVEMRPDGPALRRREGRHRVRPEEAVVVGARAHDAPLHERDHQRHRAGARHPRAGRRHGRARDGVDLRHVLHEQGPLRARRGHREAALHRRLAGPRRSDGARRPLLHAGALREAGQARDGPHRRDPGLRQRRRRTWRVSSISRG